MGQDPRKQYMFINGAEIFIDLEHLYATFSQSKAWLTYLERSKNHRNW